MKFLRRAVALLFALAIVVMCAGCGEAYSNGTSDAIAATQDAGSILANKYKIDIPEYSLELYNLQRRMYFINGEFEKANAMEKPIPNMPVGTILVALNATTLARFSVEGKVSSVNSYMSPSMIQKRVFDTAVVETELPDVDGSYGENDPSAIFFFTPEGDYVEKGDGYIYTSGRLDFEDPNFKIITMEGEP